MKTMSYELGHTSTNPAAGRLERIVSPTFTREQLYDVRNRLISQSDIDSNDVRATTRYAYDGTGNLLATTNPDGRITESSYDGLNRLVSRALTDGRLITIGRDVWDESVGITSPRAYTTTLHFDKLGRRVSEAKPSGKTTYFEYDEVGNVTAIIDPRNTKVQTIYDNAGRKHQEKMWPSLTAETPSKTVTYTYNNRGELTGWDDGDMSGTFDVDALGRTQGSSVDYGPFTKGAQYTFYRNGLTKAFTGPDGITYSYTYDASNQLRSVHIPNEGKISYASYRWSVPTKVTLPGGTTQQFEYDDLLRMTRALSLDPAGNTIMDQRYERDINGRIEQKITEEGTYEYGYDAAYQLTSVVGDVMPNEAYTYDANGNRLPADPVQQTAWGYNADDQLLATPTMQYEYDERGSVTKAVTANTERQFTYDEQGNLVLVEMDDTPIATYGYDPHARRAWKDNGASRRYFYYTQNGLAAEIDGSGVILRSIGYEPTSQWTHSPLFVAEGDCLYFHNDSLRVPHRLSGKDGEVRWSARYAAFGAAQIDLSAVDSRLRFAGQYEDDETLQNQNWHRYYDPLNGRYISVDPIGMEGGGTNFYTYAFNDPINLTDPHGLAACYVGFPDYPVEFAPGWKTTWIGGHAGVLGYDEVTGVTRYYEYGRYGPTQEGVFGARRLGAEGNVRLVRMPKLTIGKDGRPTDASLSRLRHALSREVGKGTQVVLSCNDGLDEKKVYAHVDSIANDPTRDPYNWKPWSKNHCRSFAEGALNAGQ